MDFERHDYQSLDGGRNEAAHVARIKSARGMFRNLVAAVGLLFLQTGCTRTPQSASPQENAAPTPKAQAAEECFGIGCSPDELPAHPQAVVTTIENLKR